MNPVSTASGHIYGVSGGRLQLRKTTYDQRWMWTCCQEGLWHGFPLKCDFDHPSNSCMCCIKIEVLFMRKDLLYSDDFLIIIVYISETFLNMHLNCHNCFDHKWHKSVRPEMHMWLFVYKWFACVYECYGCDSVSVHICFPDRNNHSYSLAGFPPSLFSFYPAECINPMQNNQADRNKQINIRHLQRNKTSSTTRIRKCIHCRLWKCNLAYRLVCTWGLCGSFRAVNF